MDRLTVTYQREPVQTIWPELMPLLEKHYEEIAHFKDIPLEPDVERYNALERTGTLRVFTVRASGVLAGYGVFGVMPALHYKSSKQAVEDVLFVDPAHRNGRLGIGLIQFCEAALKAEGVEVIYHHIKKAHPQLGRVLEALGYEPIDEIYGKRI